MKLIFDQLTSLGSNTTENQLVLQILAGLNDQYESTSLILQQTQPLPGFYNTRSRLCQVEDHKNTQAKLSAQATGTALTQLPMTQTDHLHKTDTPLTLAHVTVDMVADVVGVGRIITVAKDRQTTTKTNPTAHTILGPLHLNTHGLPGPTTHPAHTHPAHPDQRQPSTTTQAQACWARVPPLTTRPNPMQPPTHQPTLLKPSTTWLFIRMTSHGPWIQVLQDLRTKKPILQCNSSGDLYTLSPSNITNLQSASTFAAISQDTWHQRLSHPGPAILQSLKTSEFIKCGSLHNKVCSSCIFGKHIRLLFAKSITSTTMPFDLVHSDVWTSPIISNGGHRYYMSSRKLSDTLKRSREKSQKKMISFMADQIARVVPKIISEIQGSNTPPSSADSKTEKTRSATGMFQGRALEWWSNERNICSNEEAYALPWSGVRELMMLEFCPPHEQLKLEEEFWHLKQIGDDNLAYTTCFKQLSLIVPHLVSTPKRMITKYINGLPPTIEEVYRLAASLNNNRVRDKQFANPAPSKSAHQVTQQPSGSKNKRRKS
ncbi:uncharacterized protein LOC118488323 [Helianthus annuus]|uniref:uncharacterized protein LOC118488323 n=1 Tax=Helianthus annuus TaxID=4232 RepID=UPI001652FF1C|nr:uncharacterized protein LOC118488323 [Helianthus annuus]